MDLHDMDKWTLERHPHPPTRWLVEYRMCKAPERDYKTGEEITPPVDFKTGKPVPTLEECAAWNVARRERLKELNDSLRSESFGSESSKVRIDFKGARFTLDSDDHAGIKRIMDMINRG